MNPKATPFIPRNFDNNDKKETNEVIKSIDFTKSEVNSTANGSKPSTSKITDKSKSKKKSKPTKVTLEQFISEKLKIDDEIKPKKVTISSTHNLKHKNKTQTHEMPNNLLDSSAPTRKRGKERESPKVKKPTTLKKIIIQEKSSSLEKSNNESIDIKTENDSQTENSDINDSKVVVNNDLDEINKKILHNKTYREYCNQKLSQEIDNIVVNLLSDLVVFQDRLYIRDPLKAKIRKRLSFGFREVTKYAIVNKVKMLIIAPDIEKIETKGGLDDTLTQLFKIINNNETPVVFALTRRNLGITCKKRGFISCVGVLNYDGSQVSLKII